MLIIRRAEKPATFPGSIFLGAKESILAADGSRIIVDKRTDRKIRGQHPICASSEGGA